MEFNRDFEGDGSNISTSTGPLSISDESSESTSSTYSLVFDDKSLPSPMKIVNITQLIVNRQIYGKFTKKVKGKSEKLLKNMHFKGRYALSTIITDQYDTAEHIFLGFTACGRYLLSYVVRPIPEYNFNNPPLPDPLLEFYLYVWRFAPGAKMNFISKHRIFKDLKYDLVRILYMQAPNDYYRIVCYGVPNIDANMVYISIVTLACEGNCKHCNSFSPSDDQSVNQGWCAKHGYSIHYMFWMSQVSPLFNPHIFLAYPDHIIVHAGHHIHLLKVTTVDSQIRQIYSYRKDINMTVEACPSPNCGFNDVHTDVSEGASECSSLDSQDVNRMRVLCDDGPIVRKVYSPSLCNFPCHSSLKNGNLITDAGFDHPKWVRKIVKLYSRKNFETGSLLYGQSRDDHNTPVEVPVIVEIASDSTAGQLNEVQLITTQKTLDCEQFINQVSKKLCADADLIFMHFQKYYIEIIHVCPENQQILCRTLVEIVTENSLNLTSKFPYHTANFLFLWNIEKGEFIVEGTAKLSTPVDVGEISRLGSTGYVSGMDSVWAQDINLRLLPKAVLKDRQNYFEVCLQPVMVSRFSAEINIFD